MTRVGACNVPLFIRVAKIGVRVVLRKEAIEALGVREKAVLA